MNKYLLKYAAIKSTLAIGALLVGCTTTSTTTDTRTGTKSEQTHVHSAPKTLTEETIDIETPEFSAQLPLNVVWEDMPQKKALKKGVSYFWRGVGLRNKNNEYKAEVSLRYVPLRSESTFLDSVSNLQTAIVKTIVASSNAKLIRHDDRIISTASGNCLEYETLYKVSPNHIKIIGYICPHPMPDDKQNSIYITYQCNFYPDDEPQEFQDSAYNYFNSMKLK